MRPDEHRRKKNDAYKKKHNIPTPKSQSKKGSAKAKLGSNADRYDDTDSLSSQQTGKNLKDLLDTVHPLPVTSMDNPTGVELGASMLSLNTSSIAAVIKCLPLTDLLDLKPDSLVETELKKVSGDVQKKFSDYIDNRMDTVYTVDHQISKPITKEEIYFNNCGKIKDAVCSGEMNERNDCLLPQVDNSVKDADIAAGIDDVPEEKEAELEQWLDSLLDD